MAEVSSELMLIISLMLGLQHAFEPDHVIAVTSILSNVKSIKKSLFQGLIWGLGHSITILIVGVIVLASRSIIPESIAQLFEVMAGSLLIVLGSLVIKELLTERKQSPNNKKTDQNLINSEHNRESSHHNHHHSAQKSLFAGILQGLSGSAALMLVTLSTINSTVIGIIFIALYGLGVTIGMFCYGAIMGGCIAFANSHINKGYIAIKAITGCISIGFGIYIISEVILTVAFL